ISPESRTSIPFVMDEHDLEYPIDYRESQEDIFPLQQHATMVTTEGLRLRCEKKCAGLAQDAANYAASNKITLSGNSQFSSKNTSDPIGVVEDAKDAVRLNIGKAPNVMVIGYTSFKALKQHPQLTDRIKYAMKGILTAELMQEIFGVEKIVVGASVSADDVTGAFTDLWADNIVLAYVPQTARPQTARPQTAAGTRSVYEPSFAYTLRKKGQPQVDTRPDNGGKLQVVRSTDIFLPLMVGAEAGYLIADTNS
ncbi:MAG: hypothetical protein HY894_06490, partial [Deltaproteobacteria bacterium]|nr:hypothetical protein [Deltaproteobacteria bacterium]